MPQGRRPTAEEVLGLQPRRPTAEEVLGIAPRRPSAEEVLGIAPQQPPQESTYEWLRRNAGLAGQRFLRGASDVGQTAYEIGSSALSGDFRPLRETVEQVGRGALKLAAGNPYTPATAIGVQLSQDPKIAEVEQRQAARREAGPDAAYWRASREDRARIAAEEAKDPRLSSRILRGAVGAAPYVAVGALTGGSVPAMAAFSGAMSLDEPASLPLNVALSSIPVGGARAVRSAAVGRVLGKGAQQIIEAEAAQAAGATARTAAVGSAPTLRAVAPGVAGQIRATGATAQQAAIRAASPSANLELAIAQGAQELPRSLAQRAGAEVAALYNVPRALVASADVSAPLRQGALLTLPPSQWGRAAAAGVKMFQSFSTKRYQKIVEEIAAHPDSQIAQRAGLHLSTQARQGLRKSEEDFVSKYAGRIPIVKQSEQAYTAYLDSLRLSTFSKYRALIDKRNISLEAKQQAYRESARWLNIASGRGTLGETLDKGMDALNAALFAPRFMASRINVLDPRTYTRNLSTEGGRVVLRQQMSELMQAAGVLVSTAALAKAAGAEVSLSPSSPDFLKIKFGNRRLDLLAGEQQVMRLIYRTGAAIVRSARGEKSKPGEGALDVAGRFLRSKLAPIPSFFVDFLTRKTYTGRDFDAAKGVAQRVAPLVWQDFLEAYQKEGFSGVAATTPALFGVGVQLYDQPGGFIEQAQPLLREYTRAGRQLPEIRKLKDEPEQQFNARVKVFGEALQQYGVGLVESEEYRNADTATKDRALNLLPRRISSALLKQGEAWQLQPRVIMSDVRENQQNKR